MNRSDRHGWGGPEFRSFFSPARSVTHTRARTNLKLLLPIKSSSLHPFFLVNKMHPLRLFCPLLKYPNSSRMWKYVFSPHFPYGRGRNEGRENIYKVATPPSRDLLLCFPSLFFSSLVLFLLFPPPALLPGRDDMTTAAAVDAAAAATCVVNILHGSLRWLFLLFSQPKRKILNGRRTTSYWLTIDTSDFSEMKGEMLGLKYVFLSIICHRRKSKRTLIFELNVQVSISTMFPFKKRLRV